MKKTLAKIYSIGLLFVFAVGELSILAFAWQSVERVFATLGGLLFALVLAPTVHEFGHFLFAKANGMKLRYIKFFCFEILSQKGKKRFRFANPFAPDQTQVLPANGGNMRNRAAAYAVGGLILGGVFLAVLVALFFSLYSFVGASYFLLGAIAYAAYLFLLNLPPFEYPSGKTDTLVCRGIKRGEAAETTMLACMQIQGELSEGKSYGEIEQTLYFNLPQLPEDEPMYAMNLFLQYRYYLEKDELDNAADALNRLAASADYLTEAEETSLAVELVYMNSLFKNQAEADECGKFCKLALQADEPSAKRALAAYTIAFGEKEKAKILISQAEELLKATDILGERKSEELLINRLKTLLR